VAIKSSASPDRHREKRLRLRRQQRVEHALACAIALGLAERCRLGFSRPLRGAKTGDCRSHGKGDDAEIDAEREQGAGIERRRLARGKRGFQRNQREGEREGKDARQHRWPP
jgi:hypothetical protein